MEISSPDTWHQNPREHLDGRGFSGAVRADVADHFAGLDLKCDAIHRRNGLVFADEKILDAAPKAFAAVKYAEVFAENVELKSAVARTSGEEF